MDQGYSVLMYDFRGHGESDLGPVPWVSWGPEEAKDVIAAVDFISGRMTDAEIGLLSIFMGAAAATYAFGRDDGLAGRSNLRSMIAVQPLRYSCFVEALGMPDFTVRAGERVSNTQLGFDMAGPDFINDAPRVSVPTLVVQNQNDPWTRMEMVQRYAAALSQPSELRLVDLENSRFAAYDRIGSHPQEFFGWFDRFI